MCLVVGAFIGVGVGPCSVPSIPNECVLVLEFDRVKIDAQIVFVLFRTVGQRGRHRYRCGGGWQIVRIFIVAIEVARLVVVVWREVTIHAHTHRHKAIRATLFRVDVRPFSHLAGYLLCHSSDMEQYNERATK